MYFKSKTAITIPLVLIITCLRIYGVHSFVSFVPASHDIADDDAYDVTNPQPKDEVYDDDDTTINDVMFRLLNKILSSGLRRSQTPFGDEGMFERESSVFPGEYRPSNRAQANNMKQKRKVFWQPLGYVPAGVNIPGKDTSHSTASGSRNNVFRYGK